MAKSSAWWRMRGVKPQAWQARITMVWQRVSGLPAIHGASRQSWMLVSAWPFGPAAGGQVDGLLEQRLGVKRGVWLRWHVVVGKGEGDVEGSRAQGAWDGDRV